MFQTQIAKSVGITLGIIIMLFQMTPVFASNQKKPESGRNVIHQEIQSGIARQSAVQIKHPSQKFHRGCEKLDKKPEWMPDDVYIQAKKMCEKINTNLQETRQVMKELRELLSQYRDKSLNGMPLGPPRFRNALRSIDQSADTSSIYE